MLGFYEIVEVVMLKLSLWIARQYSNLLRLFFEHLICLLVILNSINEVIDVLLVLESLLFGLGRRLPIALSVIHLKIII